MVGGELWFSGDSRRETADLEGFIQIRRLFERAAVVVCRRHGDGGQKICGCVWPRWRRFWARQCASLAEAEEGVVSGSRFWA